MNQQHKKSESWIELNFNEIVQKISTNNIKVKQKEYLKKGALPVIDQGADYIGGYTNDISKKVDCELPVIVFGDHTKIIKFINFDFVPGADGVKVIKPIKCFDPKLFQFFLNVLINQIPDKGYARHFQHLEKTKIPFPPLLEQEQILAKLEELLSELDNGIENLKKAQEQLKTYRQAVLKYAFEGKLTEEWRNRRIQAGNPPEPAEKLLERIKIEREKHYQKQLVDWEKECEQAKKEGEKKPAKPKKPKESAALTKEELSELPELPSCWDYIRVGNLCSVVRGGSPRPAGDPKYYGGEIPFLKVADITGDTNSYLESYKFTINELGLKKTRMVKANTLLISNSGATLGVPKICLIDATFNDGIAAFLGIEKKELLFHYYFWVSKTSFLRNINQGAAQPNLNTNIIAAIPIPLCSDKEKVQIVSEIETRLSVCDKLEQIIEDSLQKSEALRQSILKKAFSGELTKDWREKHPELISGENSAEKLLERIKAEKEKIKATKKPKRKPTRKRKNATP